MKFRMKKIQVYGGVLVLFMVVVVAGYYLMAVVPYSLELQRYEDDLAIYEQNQAQCQGVTSMPTYIPCTGFGCVGKGIVAGCRDLPFPEKPVLPFGDSLGLVLKQVGAL